MLDIIVNCNLMKWQDAGEPYPPGTNIKVLRDDEEGRTVILLLPKGFKMEGHSHIKTEQHFILQGHFEIEGKVFGPGTYQLIHPEMTHGPFTSKTGAEVLVIWH
ncbi:MAG: cupin domain-containing protein [Candidatus Marinimicrobia bacterium]|nr:cupin domain-containing protein [Candidatus Neomarinimicrobiota bacterium]